MIDAQIRAAGDHDVGVVTNGGRLWSLLLHVLERSSSDLSSVFSSLYLSVLGLAVHQSSIFVHVRQRWRRPQWDRWPRMVRIEIEQIIGLRPSAAC